MILASPLVAQEQGTVTARLESTRITFGETVDLVIEVDPAGAAVSIAEPDLGDVPAVVVGRSKASQVEIAGARIRRTVVYRYRLRPLAPGSIEIPAIEVEIGGRAVATTPLMLDVVDSGVRAGERGVAARSGGPPPFFVTARVDRERVVVGDQLTLTFAFYHDPDAPLTESPDYVPPETPGFWRIELDTEPALSTERIGDRTYRVQRFDYALFPLRPGVHEIGPAAVRIVEPDPVVWWRAGATRTLRTEPLFVTADSLPAGAPAGFDGAVGRFDLAARIDDRSATVGIPLELELTIRGEGNPNTIGTPELPAWPDVEAGAPAVETATEVDGKSVRGEATVRFLLSPQVPGPVDLGTARLTYFDPDAGAYTTDSIALGEITVAPRGAPPEETDLARTRGPTLWQARSPRVVETIALDGALFWSALVAPWLVVLAAMTLAGMRRRAGEVASSTGVPGLEAAVERLNRGDASAARRALRQLDAIARDVTLDERAASEIVRAREALERVAYASGSPLEAAAALESAQRAIERAG